MFYLQGFYSEKTQKLCMIGNGVNNLMPVNVRLTLNYPNVTTLDSSIISGTLLGTDNHTGSNTFTPISILGFSMLNYTYKYVDTEVKKGVFSVYDDTENVLAVKHFHDICMAVRSVSRFELEYLEDSENVRCHPISRSCRNLPRFMSLNEIDCGEGKARYLIDFSNLNFNGRHLQFNPNITLVAEGKWNERAHLDLVACRLLNVNDSITKVYIGDCSIRLSLRFPVTLSLKNRSSAVGLMWSTSKVDDHDYFGKIAFQSPTNGYTRTQGHKYVYTVVENATRVCSKKVADKHKRRKYPNGFSSDMRFDMIVRDDKKQKAWGYSSPLFVGDRSYRYRSMFYISDDSQAHANRTIPSGSLNVSYIMSFNVPQGLKLGGVESMVNFVEISAEGTYDPKTGSLCMLGCRHITSAPKNQTLDCEILINFQFSSLNSKDRNEAKGTIESTRPKTDPLYFNQLNLSAISIFSTEARDSIWEMDFEITMVLISNTLMCIFVILQLLYVKKSPDVLPFISLVMLTVLTLAQFIPLVLNFEALFMVNRNKQNVFLGSGGWVEINEVLVRVITMVAFLLEFRLLQQAWSSRLGDGNLSSLWASDKKVVYFTLPLYISGAIIAFLLHQWKHSHKTPVSKFHHLGYYNRNNSFWLDFKSYVGLILDGFLLPQIVFNVFSNTREKALAPSFYIGITVVRLLPHAYDLYRAHVSNWYAGGIYADPGMDYYSTIWDITISIGGFVFIVLIYLQQRFGGCCFLPRRFRERGEYEKVPVVSTELSQR